MRASRRRGNGTGRRWRHGAAAHGRRVPKRGPRRFAWCGATNAGVPAAPAALTALSVHERALAAACNELPTDGRAQQLVFLAGYHLLAAAAGTSRVREQQPSERVARRGAAVIGLGVAEVDVALGFVRLLTVPGWHRFAIEAVLDWNAQVRGAFLRACTRT